ncbi:AAA domain-containing protein [Flavobacterium resistens]|uniref:AAA domain-containing protein n=1 Tax=Flavobacterium resistens TaxID=443612 RepID=A0A521B6I8_9FLAO|nr:ATP-binding protein [Flavobacterium resistens]MRX70299.1 AAA family ATPase [Flavobacterium resistens]SMO42280.1 AAA domain-containing protein [Flavobacterium resistens]
MTHQNKIQTVEALERFIIQKGSANKVAAGMAGVSAALLSQMRNHNWDLISDEMWRKVAKYVGVTANGWNYAETRNSKDLLQFFNDSQQFALVMAITGKAGAGKSETAKKYEEENKNAFVLSCNEYWDKRWFLRELLGKMGKDHAGLTLPEMMHKAVQLLKSLESPVIILDEADKLADNVLLFFITLYNALENHCGIVLMATHFLEKRIKRGVAMEKKGYREIYSRVGLRFIELEGTGYSDVENICLANGIEEKDIIRTISKECDGDVRRVRRLIFSHKRAS